MPFLAWLFPPTVLDPSDQAVKALNAEQYHDAIKYYTEAIKRRRVCGGWTENLSLLYCGRGFCHEELQLNERALYDFTCVGCLAIELMQPGDVLKAVHYRNQSVALFRTGKYQKALNAADCAIAADPKDPNNHRQRGCVLAALDRLKDAAEACAAGLEICSNDEDLINLIKLSVKVKNLHDMSQCQKELSDCTKSPDESIPYPISKAESGPSHHQEAPPTAYSSSVKAVRNAGGTRTRRPAQEPMQEDSPVHPEHPAEESSDILMDATPSVQDNTIELCAAAVCQSPALRHWVIRKFIKEYAEADRYSTALKNTKSLVGDKVGKRHPGKTFAYEDQRRFDSIIAEGRLAIMLQQGCIAVRTVRRIFYSTRFLSGCIPPAVMLVIVISAAEKPAQASLPLLAGLIPYLSIILQHLKATIDIMWASADEDQLQLKAIVSARMRELLEMEQRLGTKTWLHNS